MTVVRELQQVAQGGANVASIVHSRSVGYAGPVMSVTWYQSGRQSDQGTWGKAASGLELR